MGVVVAMQRALCGRGNIDWCCAALFGSVFWVALAKARAVENRFVAMDVVQWTRAWATTFSQLEQRCIALSVCMTKQQVPRFREFAPASSSLLLLPIDHPSSLPHSPLSTSKMPQNEYMERFEKQFGKRYVLDSLHKSSH